MLKTLHTTVPEPPGRSARPRRWRLPPARVVAGLLAFSALATSGCGARSTARPRNILILSIDALRADHVGSYGYGRPTTPCIDALAEHGVTFEFAMAASNWTVPSVASLLTSRYPSEHGAMLAGTIKNLDGQAPGEIRPGIESVAETLGRVGFKTALFSANPFVTRSLARGFAQAEVASVAADALVDDVFSWVRDAGASPFFVYVHFMDLHQPIHVPEPYFSVFPAAPGGKRLARHGSFGGWGHLANAADPEFLAFRSHRLAVYDGAVLFVDSQVQRLLALLDASSRLRDTLVIVTSDHGEEMWDHAEEERTQALDPRGYWGIGHGHSMHQEILHVPLILSGPRAARGHRVACPTSHLDLVPTLLDLLGVAAPSGLRGVSRAALVEGAGEGRACVRVPLFADSPAYGPATQVIVDGPLKLIVRHGAAPSLFDLERDPAEHQDLAASRPADVAGLAKRLAAVLPADTGRSPADPANLDPETREKLRALGYINGGGQ